MLFKIIFIMLFLGVVASLISALMGLMNQKENTTRVLKSLAWRVGFSITLFLFLIVLNALGVVQLHGISPTA